MQLIIYLYCARKGRAAYRQRLLIFKNLRDIVDTQLEKWRGR